MEGASVVGPGFPHLLGLELELSEAPEEALKGGREGNHVGSPRSGGLAGSDEGGHLNEDVVLDLGRFLDQLDILLERGDFCDELFAEGPGVAADGFDFERETAERLLED